MKTRLAMVAVVPLFLSALLVLSGCGDDGGSTADPGTPDTDPPGVAGVTAVDEFHVDVEFDEGLKKATAERSDNYHIIPVVIAAQGAAPAQGDTIFIEAAALDEDGRTVHLSTAQSMSNIGYTLEVQNVQDNAGNAIDMGTSTAFTGSGAMDSTPPTIVSRSPAPGATGVGIGQQVVVQFSESMDWGSVQSAFSWTGGGGSVTWNMEQTGGSEYTFTAMGPLANSTTYTVALSGAAEDWAGNGLAPTQWTFTTTAQVDNTPPTLSSSTPSDGATNVAVTTNIVMTFSEPVNQNLEQVIITPDPGDGIPVFSNGGRTVTFDPFMDLMDDTQYNLLIPPGAVRDLAGNGNTSAITFTWTTGAGLASGSFSGMVAGDPDSDGASDPQGAIVVAADQPPFGDDDDFGISGIGTVQSGGAYSVMNLPDGMYYPFAIMDSNGDGNLDPETGDAIGLYGVDPETLIGIHQSVTITEGSTETGVDFGLFDPHTIAGTVAYTGSEYTEGGYNFYVGVFDTTGFNPFNLGGQEPDYGTDGFYPGDPTWRVSELTQGLQPGAYYVGAYMDVNFNGPYDPGTDPAGLYMDGGELVVVVVENGNDVLDVHVEMEDPVIVGSSAPVTWPEKPVTPEWVERIRKAVRSGALR